MIQILSACAEPRPSAPTDLESLRAEIDDIDAALLALMERRLSRAAAIAELKAKEQPNRLRLRPDRERYVLGRMSGCASTLPKPAVQAIWRELMGLSLQSQKRTEVILCAPHRAIAVTDAARRRFGCQAPMLAAESPEEALDRARTNEAVAAVELSPSSSWWVALAADECLTIFDHLEDSRGRITALLIGRVGSIDDGGLPSIRVLTEAQLCCRMEEGEVVRPLAMAGGLRLCMLEGTPALDECGR